jgi:hypothetical protein
LLRFLSFFIRVNVMLFIGLIAGAEILASFAVSLGPEPLVYRAHPVEEGKPWDDRIADDVLGYRGIPNSKVGMELRAGERLLYDAVYTIDQLGRRKTPVEAKRARDKYVLFFGGSFTFGSGVADNETLPYYFGSMSENYVPYNYAWGGYGPQHTLAKLENYRLRDEVKEGDGIAIYVFIDDHVKRAVNTMRTFWVHRSPYYFLNEQGQVVRNGNFNEARPLLYRLYHDFLLRSNLLKILHVDFPLSIREEHIRLTGKIIAAAKGEFKRQFSNDNFFVLMHPRGSNFFGPKLKEFLAKEQVLVLELDDLVQWKDSYFINVEFDLHPNANGNRATADALSRIIADWSVGQGEFGHTAE